MKLSNAHQKCVKFFKFTGAENTHKSWYRSRMSEKLRVTPPVAHVERMCYSITVSHGRCRRASLRPSNVKNPAGQRQY